MASSSASQFSSIYHVKEHIIDASYIREFPRGLSRSQDETLKLHVKQYTPKDNPTPAKGDVTIIGGHANGFPKELYEPLWEELYHETKSRGLRIRTIFIADTAWQGQSGVINKDAIGNDPGWYDYARDIYHMLNVFRPPPPLIGIGHSFGGNSLTNVALLHPRILTSLVLIDPVIHRFALAPHAAAGLATMSAVRRDVWPSKKAAIEAFNKSPFYKSWDPRVLDRWVDYGIRKVEGQETDSLTKTDRWLEYGTKKPLETEAVTLTTTKHQEVFTFVRPSWEAYDAEGKEIINPEVCPDMNPPSGQLRPVYPVYRSEGDNTFERLKHVRPGVLYVFGTKSDISADELQDAKMTLTGTGTGGSGGAKAGRVTKVVGNYGHLIPMEAPQFCASSSADWIQSEVDRWWKEERKYEEWTKLSVEEKTTLTSEHNKYLGVPLNGRRKEKAKI